MQKKNNAGTNNISLSYAGIVSVISGILIHVISAIFEADTSGFRFAVYTLPFIASILGYFVYWGLLSLHLPSTELMKEEYAFSRSIKGLKAKANKLNCERTKAETLKKIDEMESNRIAQQLERLSQSFKTSQVPDGE